MSRDQVWTMTDSRIRAPIRVDLHTAMGDPIGAHGAFFPTDAENRMRLARHEIGLADYWYLRGHRKYLERDFRSAVEALNISLLHDPTRPEAHFTKGVCLQLMGLSEAEAAGSFPETVTPRAHSILMKARWAFSIALELNPHDEEARTYMAGIEALVRQN